ncbi:Uncharacterized protein TCM_025344 [Theobroma cacao]|uniref:Uncharacterized protein n=1 Tax=Theobroma cacao TaxID=3641 RepID=A0A061EZ72_THECC|nr:Uncharacterized protein TCM_025344 [Theobroma cacao]
MLQKQLFNIVGIQFGMAMAYGYGSLPGDQLMCCTCTDVIVAISSFRCPVIFLWEIGIISFTTRRFS